MRVRRRRRRTSVTSITLPLRRFARAAIPWSARGEKGQDETAVHGFASASLDLAWLQVGWLSPLCSLAPQSICLPHPDRRRRRPRSAIDDSRALHDDSRALHVDAPRPPSASTLHGPRTGGTDRDCRPSHRPHRPARGAHGACPCALACGARRRRTLTACAWTVGTRTRSSKLELRSRRARVHNY